MLIDTEYWFLFSFVVFHHARNVDHSVWNFSAFWSHKIFDYLVYIHSTHWLCFSTGHQNAVEENHATSSLQMVLISSQSHLLPWYCWLHRPHAIIPRIQLLILDITNSVDRLFNYAHVLWHLFWRLGSWYSWDLQWLYGFENRGTPTMISF